MCALFVQAGMLFRAARYGLCGRCGGAVAGSHPPALALSLWEAVAHVINMKDLFNLVLFVLRFSLRHCHKDTYGNKMKTDKETAGRGLV